MSPSLSASEGHLQHALRWRSGSDARQGCQALGAGTLDTLDTLDTLVKAWQRLTCHFGIARAQGRRTCPHGAFLPVRMQRYAEAARHIREILLSFTPQVEPLSLDEAFLDVRGCEGLFGPAQAIARQIKERIRAETDLIASVGVALNK